MRINFVNINMSDILACVECCCAIALHLSGEYKIFKNFIVYDLIYEIFILKLL